MMVEGAAHLNGTATFVNEEAETETKFDRFIDLGRNSWMPLNVVYVASEVTNARVNLWQQRNRN